MKHLLLTAVVLLSTLPLPAAPVTARSLPSLMPAPESALRFADELALTSAQRKMLEARVGKMEAETQKLNEATRRESDLLAQLLAAEKPDDAVVAAQFEKVLAAENEVKRVRLKLSLQTRAVLSAVQQSKLAALQSRGGRTRAVAPAQEELVQRMERVKQLIERAKSEGRDLSRMREMWKRVDRFTREGQLSEASRLLEETAQSLEATLAAPPAK